MEGAVVDLRQISAEVTDDSAEDAEDPASGTLAEGAGLNLNERQARFGVIFLRAVAAQAGVGLDETSVGEDVLAMDATLQYAESGVRVQIKATRVRDMDPSVPEIRYHAKRAWIDKWRKNVNPCYFVVVVVPSDSDTWLDHHTTGTNLSGVAAFWSRIDVAALDQQPTIVVPKSQRLSALTLTIWHRDLVAQYGGGVTDAEG